jgi:biopolymer transport protein ExbD
LGCGDAPINHHHVMRGLSWMIAGVSLIFLAAHAAATPAVPSNVELKKQLAGFGGNEVPIQIAIHPNGELEINGAPCDLEYLRQRLVVIHRNNPRCAILIVAGDDVPEKQIHAVMKACAEVNLKRVLRVKKAPQSTPLPAVQN